MVLYPKARNHFAPLIFFLWFYELWAFLPELIFIAALSIGLASLVAPLADIQYLFVFLFALIMSRWKSSILKEYVTKKTVAVKLAAILLIIAGVFLLA